MIAIRRVWIGVAATASLGLLLAGCGPEARFRHTATLQVSHVADSAIDVATANGGVTITATEREGVEIIAEIRATTQERADAVAISAERLAEGTLRVRAEWPGGRRLNSESCSFDIRLPDATGANVESANGAIALTGLGGEARAVTSNGRVMIERQGGPVDVRTSNGAISVLAPGGDVKAFTSNGSIRIEDAPGAVECESSNGAIYVLMTESAPGPVQLISSNGAIDLRDGEGFRGLIAAETSNARVHAPGMTNGVLKVTGDGPKSQIRTSNGSIDIERR